jgi:hypothetical protein
MKDDYEFLNSLWRLSSSKMEAELKKFTLAFNKKWIGDNTEFIYIKVFKTPEELGEFVISSSLLASNIEEMEDKINMTINEWREVCKSAEKNLIDGDVFKNILLRKLKEIF